ncbi:cysteine desulfurase [Kineosphaera limosa NBRC 100340]|uniref:Cysteine desulfurase n=2 Tax=Kineosphaera TaxID=211469 RepID=K6VHM1_9MICO|nr:cysteine desulfurase [Kineosphaera limosa NBRC 100340]
MSAELAQVGNPSSQHGSGRDARRRLEERREEMASALGARPSELLVTSGGTEADNLAVIGLFRARKRADATRVRLIVSALEHPAVRDVARTLVEREGAQLTWVQPDRDGIVTVEAMRAALAQDGGPQNVALAACMWVNNEIGTIQPVEQIAQLLAEHDIPLHVDAVQAAGRIPFDFAALGAATAAVSGHKLGGPTGVGLLLARRDAPLEAVSLGGGQERGIRSGTLAGGLVAGLSTALVLAVAEQGPEAQRLVALRDRLITGAQDLVPGTLVTGAWEPGDSTRRSPSNAHLLVPDSEGDSLLFLLDAAGIECSTGSACHAGVPQPSDVVLAMGYSEEQARGALRLSLGHTSTEADVEAFLAAFGQAVQRAQRAHRAARAG